jgi:ankyrin repeat protein
MKSFFAVIVLTTLASTGSAQSLDLAEFGAQNTAYVEIKGVVQDGRTASAIEGANVLAVWVATSYGIHSSTRHCLRVAGGRTDVQGRFSIIAPAAEVFRRGLAQLYVDVRIYKAGWREQPSDNAENGRVITKVDQKSFSLAAMTQGGLLTERRLTFTARLFPSREDSHERLRALRTMSQPPREDCATQGERPAIQDYFTAISREANQLANTPYEKALAAVMAERARKPIDRDLSLRDNELAIMSALYSFGENQDDLDRRDAEDKTPLMRAADAGDAEKITRLLQQGANPNRTRPVMALTGDDSALTIAMNKYGWMSGNRGQSGEKYLAVIKALLSNPATDPNVRDRRIDYTPLMKAIELGQDSVTELLLNAGADPNLTAYGKRNSALQIAVKRAISQRDAAGGATSNAMNQLVILLASKKVDLNMVENGDGQTALTASASSAAVPIVRLLLEAGADPNVPDLATRTPLIAIAENAILNPGRPHYVETFRLIAEWPGVRADARYSGMTALQMVQKAGRTDLAAILIEKRK